MAEAGTEIVVSEVLPYLTDKLPEIITTLINLSDIIDPDPTDDVTILSKQDEVLTALNTLIEQQNTLLTLMSYVFLIIAAFFVFKILYKIISVINGS